MAVAIVTDSTANLSDQEARALGVTVIPSYLFFGEKEEYKEGVSLDYSDFVDKLKNTSLTPQTAPPSAAEFVKTYQKLGEQASQIVSLHLTSKISNIYRNAIIARDMMQRSNPDISIYVVDTQMVDLALSFLVKEAARMAAAGKEAVEIASAVEKMRQDMGGYLYIDTLEFLKRGGRVTRLAAFFGGLLNLKPILKLDNGELNPVGKVSGKEKALDTIIDLLKKDIPEGREITVGVCDALDKDGGDQLLNLLRTKFQCHQTLRARMCQSVMIHAGPGALAVFYHIL